MRKVIGIGETILDIIFRNNRPHTAVPGGSTFNGLISLGRWVYLSLSSAKWETTMSATSYATS